MAPYVAAASLVVAAASRLAGWPAVIPISAVAAGLSGLAAWTYASRRDRGCSDSTAAAIDTEAGLGGELRSANWFAARDTRSPWADYHLDRAAERLRAFDWTALYPAIRAPRAQLATSAMMLVALALALVIPDRPATGPSAVGSGSTAAAPDNQRRLLGEGLSPELQKQLEALLAAAESGNLQALQHMSAAEQRDLLAQLERLNTADALQELARALDPNANVQTTAAAEVMKALAERAKRASETSAVSPEARQALATLAENLSEAARTLDTASKQPTDAMASKERQQGDAVQTNAGSDAEEMSVQVVKEADAGGGMGVIMMSDDNVSKNARPGSGVGGGSSMGAGTKSELEAALRRETIEASADNPGENVMTEMRRKTEHGQAKVAYTHSASRTFDRSRAAAPPAVPEARRSGVQTYFIRKP